MTAPVVIVTGASRGIGAATARWLADVGTSVVLVARSFDGLASVAADIEVVGAEALVLPDDVSDPSAARRVVAATLSRFGRIDAIVNNAGSLEPVSAVSCLDLDEFQRVMRLNLIGPLALAQAALPSLRDAPGRIVNLVTVAATMPIPALSAYAASKAALVQLTRVLAIEERDIVSVALDPGPTDSGMMETLRSRSHEAMPAAWAERYDDMKRGAMLRPPAFAARAIAWLALSAPMSMSGDVVTCDRFDVHDPALARFGGMPVPTLALPAPPD